MFSSMVMLHINIYIQFELGTIDSYLNIYMQFKLCIIDSNYNFTTYLKSDITTFLHIKLFDSIRINCKL